MTRIAIRIFDSQVKVFEDCLDADRDDPRELFERHAKTLGPDHMFEIEFLDEPDSDQRFFRFGTDPSGMVQPLLLPIKSGPSSDVMGD